jgi:serine/threonine protein kinase
MTAPEVRQAYAKVSPLVHEDDVYRVVEALLDARLSPKADVWALGCILLQLLLGPRRSLTPGCVDAWRHPSCPAGSAI